MRGALLGFLALCALVSARVVSAQSLDAHTISDDGTSAILEFTFDWAKPLQETVDSSGVAAWDGDVLARFAAGFDRISHLFDAGAYAEPALVVQSRDFEEVAVSLSGSATRATELVSDVEIVGLGYHRRRPVVSVVARAYLLDTASGRLRRYRRIRVQVTRSAPVGKIAAGEARPAGAARVETSVLADGTIYRVPIVEEGIYRVDRAFLTGLGLNPDTIDPNNIAVYGNGGKPLPAKNDAFRHDDLAANAVFVRGGGDGRFDTGDVVLFYGAPPRGWMHNGGNWLHYVHPFSNGNAYFLKIGSASTARAMVPHVDAPGASTVSSTLGRHFTDIEEYIWSREHGSGHDWMSRTIREGTSRIIFENVVLPGLLAGTIRHEVRAAIASNPRATVAFESGGATLAQMTAPTITINAAEFPSASTGQIAFNQSVPAGAPLNLRMTLPNQTNEPEAAVDWARVFYDRALVAQGGYLRFATDPGWAPGEYLIELSGFASAPLVWDVTTADAAAAPEVRENAGPYRFRHVVGESTSPVEYVAFTESVAQPIDPETVSPVTNQNLHGLSGYPDLVIVTPEAFLPAANRLADHRRGQGLEVVVSLVEQIYNEFSGGVPDMRAVRDYFKFLYDRAPDESTLLRYALLLGDGHYDFRGLSSLENQESNWVFPFETEESLITDATYTSDDYFGLLDDNEGVWTYTTFSAVSNERVDIGVGRLPAQTLSEADLMIDKTIRYDDPETFGPWRSRYVAVADDGPTGLSGSQDDADLHLQNIDQVAELLRVGQYPRIDFDKIYAESYERVFQNGFRIPGAAEEIRNVLEDGALVFNYTGHGGPDGLAQERIFTQEHAADLTNGDRLPLFITATCSFGWWDLETGTSGAETLLLNEQGGAVGLFTTVRLVYTSGDTTSLNAGLNRALNIEMFRTDEEDRPRRLGDVMRLTKNTNVGLQGNSRKLSLLADPSMRLGIPEDRVVVEEIDGIDLDTSTGQVKALDLVELSGYVGLPDGSVNASFEGTANVTVFDAVRRVPILKQVRMPTPYYNIREDLIWRGEVEVREGRFTARFVVPKDISYANELGRISVYAAAADGDALGYTENFLVGGTSDNPPDDAAGPQISLFLADTTFVSGGVVPDEPELIVKLFDESGINTVGAGVGHEMLLVVDGDEGDARDISSGFVADRNSYQRGEVRWRLESSEAGPHTLSVRAWDVLNNSSTSEVSYVVSDDEVLSLSNVYNYPNPMNRETRFEFDHNQPAGTSARVRIRIFTLSGRPIRTIDTDESLPGGVLTSSTVQIPWDGRDEDYDRPATGIYLYTLRVEVDRPDGATHVSEHVEKLAIIR